MTKTTVFTLQEWDVAAKKAGGNVTTHSQHRIIYFCIIYASS